MTDSSTLKHYPDSARGFPKVFDFGLCGSVQCLVMEILGPNLGDLLRVCGGRFSLQTCLVIAIQVDQFIWFSQSNSLFEERFKTDFVKRQIK